MFYSSNQIKNLIICQICKNRLVDPRVVYCGRTFCNSCITKSDERTFKCPCDEKLHEIPIKGFPPNLTTVFLLEQYPCKVSRGEKAEQLRLRLEKIESEMSFIEKNLDLSQDVIYEHCFSIRDKINLETEAIIQNIQNQRNEMMRMVNVYEKACLDNLTKEADLKNELEIGLEEIREFCLKWKKEFDQFDMDESEIAQAIDYSHTYIINLEALLVKLKKYIFCEKIIKFSPSKFKVATVGNIEFT